jgi:hypothetical protein
MTMEIDGIVEPARIRPPPPALRAAYAYALARARPPPFALRAAYVRVQLLAWDAERIAAAGGGVGPFAFGPPGWPPFHREGATARLPALGLERDDHEH